MVCILTITNFVNHWWLIVSHLQCYRGLIKCISLSSRPYFGQSGAVFPEHKRCFGHGCWPYVTDFRSRKNELHVRDDTWNIRKTYDLRYLDLKLGSTWDTLLLLMGMRLLVPCSIPYWTHHRRSKWAVATLREHMHEICIKLKRNSISTYAN